MTGTNRQNEEKYQCPYCKLKFRSKLDFDEHIKEHLRNFRGKRMTYRQKERIVRLKKAFKEYRLTHTKVPRYKTKCIICGTESCVYKLICGRCIEKKHRRVLQERQQLLQDNLMLCREVLELNRKLKGGHNKNEKSIKKKT